MSNSSQLGERAKRREGETAQSPHPIAPPHRPIALIIGASLTGLMAARVLADHFEQVILIERDTLPDDPTPRKGVPQAHQYHGLMGKGYAIMRKLYPQLEANLIADGVPLPDTLRDFVVYAPNGAGFLPRWESGIHIPTCSRTRLEWHIRKLTLTLPNVSVIPSCEVVRLCGDKTAVSAVQLRYRQNGSKRGTELLSADLILDCSGRHSKICDWLCELGVGAVPQDLGKTAVRYATRLYHIPKSHTANWHGLLISMQFPQNPRFGGLRQIENNLWQVALAGMNGHAPPKDDTGFVDYAKQLASPLIHDAIQTAHPATPIFTYHNSTVRRRHFHKMRHFPQNLLIIGDAHTCYNPLYGQGMTSAALAAQTLQQTLALSPSRPFAPRFHKTLARTTRPLWQQANQLDQLWANPNPANWTAKQRIFHTLSRRTLPLIAEDKALFLKATEIRHLLRPAWHGVNGRLLWRLLTG